MQTTCEMETTRAFLRPDRPDPARLDCLGRLPVPLRWPVKSALDRVAMARGAASCLLMGGEWYAPFADLAGATGPDDLPGLLITSWSVDLFAAPLWDMLTGGAFRRADPPALAAACAAAGLADPAGALVPFAVIPLVLLIDHRRLGQRPPPRRWADLLDPIYAGDIVFGGWRPHEQAAYQEVNEFLLLALLALFGADGLAGFAANVRCLTPNIRSARVAGSNNAQAAAIAVMPWLQADISPRRDRVAVVWPEDGALAMPLWSIARRNRTAPAQDLLTALEGPALAAVFDANRYPAATRRDGADGFPPGARLRWPGWDAMTGPDAVEKIARARRIFFTANVGGASCV